MSYKTKAETSLADAIPHRLARKRYPCFADGCPMPGTIFTTRLEDGDTGAGTCAWHYGVMPSDIPRVTRVLLDWQCVSYEVNEARRVLTGELAIDVKAIGEAFDGAWARLVPLVSGWEDQLRPQHGESYGWWANRLQRFLGAKVANSLRVQFGRRA